MFFAYSPMCMWVHFRDVLKTVFVTFIRAAFDTFEKMFCFETIDKGLFISNLQRQTPVQIVHLSHH